MRDNELIWPTADEEKESEAVNIVVLQADDRQFGLVVDEINDTEEIVVKPLGKILKGISAFAGATILGDGKVALILDVMGIAQRSNVISETRDSALEEKTSQSQDTSGERQTLLLIKAGQEGRMAIPLSMVSRLEEFERKNIEQAGNRDAVQYRDEILPLFHLSSYLPMASDNENQKADTLKVVVYSDEGRSAGIVVDQILDIVEENISIEHSGACEGIVGSAVVQGSVTDLVDVEAIIRAADPGFFERSCVAA
jgi:two-component system chemotaxis sensor kinase CheA